MRGIRAEIGASAYQHTVMTHISVNVNRVEAGSVEASTANMF